MDPEKNKNNSVSTQESVIDVNSLSSLLDNNVNFKNDTYLPNVMIDSMGMLLDSESVNLLKKWLTNPLAEVGPRNTNLGSIATASDGASMSPIAKSSTSASWNQLSMGYIMGWVFLSDYKPGTRKEGKKTKQVKKGYYSDNPQMGELHLQLMQNNMDALKFKLYKKDILNDRIAYLVDNDPTYDKVEEYDPETTDITDMLSEGDATGVIGKSETLYVPVTSVMESSANMAPVNPPFTPAFHAFVNKLMETSASTALMSTVRGVSIRDNASMTSLAKTLAATTQEYKDVSPLLKIALISITLSKNTQYDNTPLRYCRRMTVNPEDTKPVPQENTYSQGIIKHTADQTPMKLCFITLDAAISILLNKPMKKQPPWTNEQIDTEVVMIPVRSQFLSSHALMLYIVSFLTSEYWNGTFWYNAWLNGTKGSGPKKDDYPAALFSMMPASNSVYIPGFKKAYLVLIDETSPTSETISILNFPVNVYDGTKDTAATDGRPIWDNCWDSKNIATMRLDSLKAFKEICQFLATQDTCGTALSAASEISNLTYPGMAVDVEQQKYDTTLINGGWSYCDIDDKQTTTNDLLPGKLGGKTFKIRGDYTKDDSVTKPLTGFNFSASSPLGFEKTSLSKVTVTFVDSEVKPYVHVTSHWAGPKPDVSTFAYRISMASSIARLGTSLGFVDVTHAHYEFSVPDAISTYTKMLGTAIAPTLNHMLLSNDIAFRQWCGWDVDKNAVLDDLTMKLVKVSTVGLKIYQNMKDVREIFLAAGKPAYDYISDYYDIPVNNLNWRSHYPIGTNLLLQWEQKMDVQKPINPMIEETLYTSDGEMHTGVRIHSNMASNRAYIFSTVDWLNYRPMCFARTLGEKDQALYPWIENYPSITRPFDAYATNRILTQYLYSNNLTVSVTKTTGITTQTNEYIIQGTRLTNKNFILRVTPIVWPDPMTARDFLGKAVDYVAIPAAMGGLGFLTGGPVGAAAGAGSALVGQITHDMHKAEQQKQIDQLEQEKNQLIGAMQSASTVTGTHDNPEHPNIQE